MHAFDYFNWKLPVLIENRVNSRNRNSFAPQLRQLWINCTCMKDDDRRQWPASDDLLTSLCISRSETHSLMRWIVDGGLRDAFTVETALCGDWGEILNSNQMSCMIRKGRWTHGCRQLQSERNDKGPFSTEAGLKVWHLDRTILYYKVLIAARHKLYNKILSWIFRPSASRLDISKQI